MEAVASHALALADGRQEASNVVQMSKPLVGRA
jgi:hypothetical protein